MEQKPTSSFAAAVMPGIYLGVALIVFRLILFLLDVEMESCWPLGFTWGLLTFVTNTVVV